MSEHPPEPDLIQRAIRRAGRQEIVRIIKEAQYLVLAIIILLALILWRVW